MGASTVSRPYCSHWHSVWRRLHGEWHDAAPAERYSAKAFLDAARGVQPHRTISGTRGGSASSGPPPAAAWLGTGLAVRVGATVGLIGVVRLERVVGVAAGLVAAGVVVLVARGVSSVVARVAAIGVGLVLIALVHAVPVPVGRRPVAAGAERVLAVGGAAVAVARRPRFVAEAG